MFWGLIMEPQRRYTQQVKKAFHISMAALDVSTSSDEPAQVMCGFEGRNYLLCTLRKPDILQCPLDLSFEVGSEVSFAANGKCYVHLTGYLTDELLDTAEEESEDEQVEEEVPIKSKKRIKKSLENGPPNKKPKSAQVSSSQNENEDSDSDDSDVNVKTLLEDSLKDSDDSDASDYEGEDGEEGGEEEDEEETEEEEEESSVDGGENEEEEQKSTLSLKVNGIPKQQNQENQKQKGDKKKKDDQDKKTPKIEKKNKDKIPSKEIKTPQKRTLQGGVIIEDIKEGQGPPAKNGKFVNVYYEGRLRQNNKLFDATTKGPGFSFRLGSGEVIKGWDIGVLGMKPGGRRKIICPPAMAYGQKGSPPAIPPNSVLVFEVELKKISGSNL